MQLEFVTKRIFTEYKIGDFFAMNIAILEFSMGGFEEEYWEDSFYERRNLKGLLRKFWNFSKTLFLQSHKWWTAMEEDRIHSLSENLNFRDLTLEFQNLSRC